MANFGYFQRFLWKVEESRSPLKWQNTGLNHFNFSLNMLFKLIDICMFKLNLIHHPSAPRLIKNIFLWFLEVINQILQPMGVARWKILLLCKSWYPTVCSYHLFLQLNFLHDSGSDPEASMFSTPELMLPKKLFK